MSSPSVQSLPTRFLSNHSCCLFTDRNSRRSPRHGLLELPRASFQAHTMKHVQISLIHNYHHIQNVAGRTLVGLRFWNQVCTLRILRAHF